MFFSDEIPVNSTTAESENRFNWSSEEQGFVLGAFFYGYVLTQVVGGNMADKYSPVWLFGIGVGGTAVLSLLTALSTEFGLWGIVSLRVAMGLLSGFAMPAPSALFSKWAPPDERGKLAGLAFSGGIFGIIITMPLSGYLIDLIGWQGMFYAFGGGCCLWIPVWFWFAKDSPEKMTRINPKELAYLKATVNSAKNSDKKTPWVNIFLSLPFWVSQMQPMNSN